MEATERERILRRLNGDDDLGIATGMALAAAIMARDFDQPTYARELLGAAGLDSIEGIAALGLEEYDAAPLRKSL